jgi:DNA-binding FrmR family transcriptional regulator
MTPETQQQANRRMKIIAGQVNALARQIEDDRYCVDILDLSLSIQKALRSLDALVMEGHLRTHVVEMMQNGDQDRAIGELLKLYKVQGPAEG